MAYRDIQDKIIEKMATVKVDDISIGQVRAYYQRAITPEEFADLFQVTLDATGQKPIRAWTVSWESATTRHSGSPFQTYFLEHTFVIIGWVSWNASSEELIRRSAEAILEAFAPIRTLGLNVPTETTIVEDSLMSISNFRRGQLGPVMVSMAEISLTATERRQVNEFT